METVVLCLVILFVSTLIRAVLGFGDALLAMPLLALVVGVQTATPLVALVAIVIAVVIVGTSWRQIDVAAARHLLAASLIGIPVGLLVLNVAPERLIVGVLGVILVGFGLYRLLRPSLPLVARRRWAYLMGFVAGVLGGAYNTNGPVVVLYGSLRGWPPDRFRATLQGYFLVTSVLIGVAHGLGGLWTPQVIKLFVLSVPVVLLAIYLGSMLHARIPAHRFERMLFVAFIVLGILLLI